MSAATSDPKAIFFAALDQPSPEERLRYLDAACGSDGQLRSRVEQLLAAHDQAGQFLGGCGATTDSSISERTGTQIGPYKLLQQIGEGGMGVVYMAEQTEPVKRRVALKIIKPGMDSRQVIARFEAERQALAMMDHVNIARVLDAGTTPAGLPYFVMELVHGEPITQYCDDQRLTPRQRLELFVPVCQAIQHAHQKGIIHRDIKPTNVMVTLYDGQPVPKVIDFGVAKATEQKLTERTLFTQYGTMVGTLEYMSPEQAEMSALGADTRSDIFSLGVLLYELLTGSTPLSHKRLKEAAYGEVLRMIREEEAPKPSTRLSDSGEALASISAHRHMEPAKLSQLMRGELDWIVMKTLEKDRNRRYETATGFAADVQRYLNDEPVQAYPPSVWYRFRKFARRHKGPVLAAGLVFLALIAGITGTTIGMSRARRAAAAERVARQQAVEDKAQAEKRLAQIEKGNEILTSIFTRLNPDADKKNGQPLRAVLGEQLALAADQLAGEAIGDPLVVARLQVNLGQSMLGLDMAERAILILTKARDTLTRNLGPDHADTLDCVRRLAWAYHRNGQWDMAVPLAEETLKLTKARLGPHDPQTINAMNILGNIYVNAGKLDLGLPLAEEALRLQKTIVGPGHRDTIAAMGNLAGGYRFAGKLDLATPLLEEALKLSRANFPPDHPHTILLMDNLAATYQSAGKLDLALPLFEESLKLAKAGFGLDHRHTLWSMVRLANAYHAAGKLDLALPLAQEAAAGARKRRSWDQVGAQQMLQKLTVPGIHRDSQPLPQKDAEQQK